MKGKIILDEEDFNFVDFMDKIPAEAKNGSGKSAQARLYLPASWAGKKVRVFLLEDTTND